jgi:hypothetical protein
MKPFNNNSYAVRLEQQMIHSLINGIMGPDTVQSNLLSTKAKSLTEIESEIEKMTNTYTIERLFNSDNTISNENNELLLNFRK